MTSLAELARAGWTDSAVRAQLRARRWQRVERAVVMHNGELTRSELMSVALLNHGPRSVLTSFTAAENAGLAGWTRDDIHVLVPAGARIARLSWTRTHYTGDWNSVRRRGRSQALGPALVVAAGEFASARPACGILAAGVQQRLLRPSDLVAALDEAPRARHHALLLAAAHDIAQGAEALSEIDFARLCRRFRLPPPVRQAVRRGPGGRRRYLDAEWMRPDGRRVVVEVDGALHLQVRRWWDDQLRQNELVLAGDLVLRYPTAVVRTEQGYVAGQLARALLIR